MSRASLALFLVTAAMPAWADQIDYPCLYVNQAAAQADPVMTAGDSGGPYYSAASGWRQEIVFPGIKVTTPSALVNGISSLTGFWLIISFPARNAAIEADANCNTTWLNRDAAIRGQGFIVGGAGLTGTGRSNMRFTPVPLGSNYPQPLGQ